MGVPILVCDCGLRLRAPGAKPGRVGRCPKCGGTLRVPEETTKRIVVEREAESDGVDYFLAPSSASKREPQNSVASPPRAGREQRAPKSVTPMADGFLPPLQEPERWWLPCVVFPLRGAEGLSLVAILGVAFWVISILIPEYILTLMADAERLGATMMGYLVGLVTALPAIAFLPAALFYWLQYSARILITSAIGDTVPPRTPDRNFDGFLNGLSPWCLWLFLGVAIAMAPFAIYSVIVSQQETSSRLLQLGLLLMGLPYALMALMIIFLHDETSAANPAGVVGTLMRLNTSFLGICLVVVGLFGLCAGMFALALQLRENHFWLYVTASLFCWFAVQWTAMVVMRILGTYYYQRRKILKWHRERPRWGVLWKL
jgi:hypothetical protein